MSDAYTIDYMLDGRDEPWMLCSGGEPILSFATEMDVYAILSDIRRIIAAKVPRRRYDIDSDVRLTA